LLFELRISLSRFDSSNFADRERQGRKTEKKKGAKGEA